MMFFSCSGQSIARSKIHLKFVDYPRPVAKETYVKTIDRMLERLCKQDGILSVYQVGGVSSPGISDIDIFVVFDDGIKSSFNPLQGLRGDDQYLFLHQLFGTSISFLDNIERFTLFGKYTLLWGTDIMPAYSHDADEQRIKQQIALEYLLKFYINMTIELAYKIVKIRILLLHIKALAIDFSFLGLDVGSVFYRLQKVLEWRERWFEDSPSREVISEWLFPFYEDLYHILDQQLQTREFYLPYSSDQRIARNVRLENGENLKVSRSGFSLPAAFGGLGRKYFNIQHRINSFVVQTPYRSRNIPECIDLRFKTLSIMRKYNESHLPYFIPTAYGLSIF